MSPKESKIYDLSKLQQAWREVYFKKSSGGIDGVTLDEYRKKLDKNLAELSELLSSNSYVPDPSVRFYKYKSGGNWRPLGFCTIQDKIVQRVVKSELEKKFNPLFLDCSYAYRPKKGHKKAISRILHYLRQNNKWIVSCDIHSFFDTLDHDLLINFIAEKIYDEKIMRLIQLWLKIGVFDHKKYVETEKGILQGSVISPILSNIYLHSFDTFMIEAKHNLVRYADDFIILERKKDRANLAFSRAQKFLVEKLKLTIKNENENFVRHANDGFVYLGLQFYGKECRIADKKMKSAREKIEWICSERGTPDFHSVRKKIEDSVRNWRFYFFHYKASKQFEELDAIIISEMTGRIKKELEKGRKIPKDELELFYRELILLNIYKEKTLSGIWRMCLSNSPPEVKIIMDKLFNLTQVSSKRQTNAGKKINAKEISQSEDKDSSDSKKIKDEKSKINSELKKTISIKRRKFERKISSGVDLIISTTGAYICKRYQMIVIKKGNKTLKKVSVKDLQNVIVTNNAVTFSAAAIWLCSTKNISINLMDDFGNPYAIIIGKSYPLHDLGLAQLHAVSNGKAVNLALGFIEGKMNNQINLAKYFLKYRNKSESECVKTAKEEILRMEGYLDELESENLIKADDFQGKIFGLEGRTASSYWKIVKNLVSDRFSFPKREHRGSKDPFNCLLNYGYGILYNRVLKAICMAGLIPTFSFLHAPQKGRPNLALDLIEEFRAPVVDRTIIALCTRGEPLIVHEGRLSSETRKLVAANVLERLNLPVNFKKKRLSITEIIEYQASLIGAYIKDKKRSYQPYIARW